MPRDKRDSHPARVDYGEFAGFITSGETSKESVMEIGVGEWKVHVWLDRTHPIRRTLNPEWKEAQ